MSEPSSGFDPVEDLVDAFLERYRRGERPSLTEYTDKHPELAERIRALFPALLVMEELGSGERPGDRPSRPDRAAATRCPQRLGDYLLLRAVGSGGMGIVYEAIQESLGRHVALKMLPFHHLGDATRLERFRREARAAARLHHTHIVPVFGSASTTASTTTPCSSSAGTGWTPSCSEVKRLRRDPSRPAAAAAPDGQARPTTLALRPSHRPLPGRRGGVGRTDRRPPAPRRPIRAVPAPAATTSLSAASGDRSGLSDQPEARYCPQRGADRRPGRRGPGVRPPAGHPPPRHQALQPPAGRPRPRLGHRLRPGQGPGQRRADAHRRHRRHAAVHGAGAVQRLVRPAERRLRPGGDAVRAVDVAARVRRVGPGQADRAGAAREPAAAPPARPADSARPGDDRAQGAGQGAGRALRDGRADGRGLAAVRRGPADPGPPVQHDRAALALVPAQPAAGRRGRRGGGGAGGHDGDRRALRRPAASVRNRASEGEPGNHPAQWRPRPGTREPHGIAGRIEPSAGDPQLRSRPGRLREGSDRPGPALDDRELAVGGRRPAIRPGSTPRGPTWPPGSLITPDSRRSSPTTVPSTPPPSAPTARPSSPGATTARRRLWDAATGRPIGPPLRHPGAVLPWRSAPTARPPHRLQRQDGAALGRRHRPTRRRPSRTRARSWPWHSAPTARPSSPGARTDGAALGRRHRPAHRPALRASGRRHGPWRSAPTARPSSPGAGTARRGSGTPPPASPSARPCSIERPVWPWRSAPTARPSSPGAATARRGSGTPPPANPSASRCRHRRASPGRGVQPRRQDHPHRRARTRRRGSGTPRRTSPSARPWCIKARSWPWRSAPTARPSSPPAATTRCGCGTPSPGQPFGLILDQPRRGPRRGLQPRRQDRSSPAAMTARRSSGTRRPGQIIGPSLSASRPGRGRGLQPRRQDPPHRRAGTRRRGSGTRPPASPSDRRSAHRGRSQRRGVQPRRQDRHDRGRGPDGPALGRGDRDAARPASRRKPATVDAVAFSPDGKTFLAGYDGGSAQVWDVATRTPLGQPFPHPGCGQRRGVQPRRQDPPDRVRGRHGAALGRRQRGRSSSRRCRTKPGSWPWRSAPTARPSSPAAGTRRRGSGTPPPGSQSARPSRIRPRSWPWRSAPTARPS